MSDRDEFQSSAHNGEQQTLDSVISFDQIDPPPSPEDEQCLELRREYENDGMIRTIKAVLLGYQNSAVHVLVIKSKTDETQNWSKLPTVSLYPDEDEIDGMKRLLVQVMGLTEESAEAICKVRHVVAKWWRPNFEKEIYPYIPSHITKPKEMIKLIAVNLPKSAVFTIPKNSLLIAAPLFEIYDNVNEYGAIIANLPHVLGRFEFIYNP
ncbi:unnamed protein product [Acanthocheilonema viteae]|uniref:Cleavage and polyadenylation specificity factor subunit 5 n=2 Tax=Acanthocheilonema viteae TaxID=6277 RepID=A0A498STN1_ACAVI|nr:unnamed protein product [Acanthocheilonema viteae]